MRLATDRQKLKMQELEIYFDDQTTLEEAAQLIRAENSDRNVYIDIRRPQLNENALVVASDWED